MPERPEPDADDCAVTAYFASCRARVPAFVDRNFGLAGTLRIHRHAIGSDLLVAPVNVLLALPAFVVRIVALVLRLTCWRRASRALGRVPLSLPTKVSQHVEELVRRELFLAERGVVPDATSPAASAELARRLRRYAAARSAAAELTTAAIVGVAGLALFKEFSPGSLSAGRLLADAVSREAAAREFFAGDTLGRYYYSLLAPDTPVATLIGATLIVAVLLSFCAAFAGVLSDPVQRVTGMHRRRLQRLVRSLEGVIRREAGSRFDPKDHYYARATDLIDVLRGLWPG